MINAAHERQRRSFFKTVGTAQTDMRAASAKIVVLAWIVAVIVVAVQGSSVGVEQTRTLTRGTLIPFPPDATPTNTPTSRPITTTIDIEDPLIQTEEPEPEPGADTSRVTVAVPSSADSTDWSTVLPTRWYPRRKQDSAALRNEPKSSAVGWTAVIGGFLLAAILM